MSSARCQPVARTSDPQPVLAGSVIVVVDILSAAASGCSRQRPDDALGRFECASAVHDRAGPVRWAQPFRAARTLRLPPADVLRQIAELKAEPGGDIVVAGSHLLWNDLLAHGLVDELHLMIGAVVLGEGTPVFERKPNVHLRLVDVHKLDDSENLVTRYEVTANAEAAAPEQVSIGVTPDTIPR
jgi:hypothetical protein